MKKIQAILIKDAALDSGFSVADAVDVLRLLLGVKTNDEICDLMKEANAENKHFWQRKTRKRNIVVFLRLFILYNFSFEFREFLKEMDREFYNNDFETPRNRSNEARFIFILFLREKIGLRQNFAWSK